MFAGLLARRYIREQKRHSVLTVCSIAAALALMTMLFTCFSTAVGCARSIAVENGNYHLAVLDITKEQGMALSKAVGEDGSCKIKQIGQSAFAALITFDRYIDDRDVYIENIFSKARLSTKTTRYELNSTLIMLDMIDLNARAEMAELFALFYVFVIFFALALRLIIDTSFEVSSKERERQFGVLQSIGATPGQIVSIITYEGLLLSVIGIPVGVAAGVGLACIAYHAVLDSGLSEAYFTPEKAAELLHFHVSPLMLLIAGVTGLVWVMLSAYGTGMRIIRMSPMQAISARSNTVKKVGKHSLFGMLFGWKGKLAARNNKRQLKRFLITVISLTLSITLFSASDVMMKRMEEVFLEPLEEDVSICKDFDIKFPQGDNIAAISDPCRFIEPLQEIQDCGYFTDIDYCIFEIGRYEEENAENNAIAYIRYMCEESYNREFDGAPPVSYAELSAQNGYILMTDKNRETPERFRNLASVPLTVKDETNYTPEEYEALPPEQKERAKAYTYYDGEKKTSSVLFYYLEENSITDLTINYTAEKPGCYEGLNLNTLLFVSTTDAFANGEHERYGNGNISDTISCNVADEEQYREALHYLEQSPTLKLMFDLFGLRQKMIATFAAIRIGVTFIDLMIALIAIVNMVNILSTGILNRRNEIASMQCIGMTERQLYGMTIVECLQYALGAAVMASVLCGLLAFSTEMMMETMMVTKAEDMLSYALLLPRIAGSTMMAFIVALLASVLPLRRMQKTSLVEQMRTVD